MKGVYEGCFRGVLDVLDVYRVAHTCITGVNKSKYGNEGVQRV